MATEDCFDDDFDNDLLVAAESNEAKDVSQKISDSQKARAEKNRMKAIALKKARLSAQPYPDPKKKEDFLTGEKVKEVNLSFWINSVLNTFF